MRSGPHVLSVDAVGEVAEKLPRNRYWFVEPRTSQLRPWNPLDARDLPVPECDYLGRVLAAMEQAYDRSGLKIYVTFDIRRLPSYGDDVVAIVLRDEWARMPFYAPNVRAVFKTYGTRFAIEWSLLRRPSQYALLCFVQDVRISLARLPSVIASRLGRARRRARVFDIPLGYFTQVELPLIPIAARSTDISFAGSVKNNINAGRFGRWWRSWIRSPKNMSRTAMFERLEELGRRHPDLRIFTKSSGNFFRPAVGEREYSEALMDSKLCILPRGSSLETYRFFEGLRAGCVLVGERLPSRWFYDGAPVEFISDWGELEDVVVRLRADPAEMQRRQDASLAWWTERCCPEAVGRFIAEHLKTAGRDAGT